MKLIFKKLETIKVLITLINYQQIWVHEKFLEELFIKIKVINYNKASIFLKNFVATHD